MTGQANSPSSLVLRLAVVQIAAVFFDARATWDKLIRFALHAINDGAEVIVWGESLLPGYPCWVNIDAAEFQQQVYVRYWDQAIKLDSPLIKDMQAFAKKHRVMLVGGITERDKGSMYDTTLTIGRDGTLLGRHRKIKQTLSEQVVWTEGDADGLKTYDTKIGKLGALNSQENWHALARTALYAQSEVIHIGVWPGNLQFVTDITRFIALEGCVWSVAASGLLRWSDIEHLDDDVFPVLGAMRSNNAILQNGGSQIVAPDGEVVAGPLVNEEGLLMADLPVNVVRTERQKLGSIDHRLPNDILSLQVNRRMTINC